METGEWKRISVSRNGPSTLSLVFADDLLLLLFGPGIVSEKQVSDGANSSTFLYCFWPKN